MSQAEAARLHGVSRQAINKLVRTGRLRTFSVGGRVLVSREDVEAFRPQLAGRPSAEDPREFERIRTLLESASQNTVNKVYAILDAKRPRHPIETRIGANADVILEALNRAGELTIRMFRGVIAEAAFYRDVVCMLPGWKSTPIEGATAFDYRLEDVGGVVRVQVKLQRSENGTPLEKMGYYVVEPQRTRGGKRKSVEPPTSERLRDNPDDRTRPYRYGEFDILAVCLRPSTGNWDDFRYTVANWLLPEKANRNAIATRQPVSREPDEDWTDDFPTCVRWFRSGKQKRISGRLAKPRGG